MMSQLSSKVKHEQTESQHTALYENHCNRGARMVDFAGWQMPLQYGRVMEEHHAVRQAAGLFDVSHMGLVTVTANSTVSARLFLNRLVPQNLDKMTPGKAMYTQFLNEQGGIIDDIIVYQLPETEYLTDFQQMLVVCNAANVDKDMAWMEEQVSRLNAPGIKIGLHRDYSLLALQGPQFDDILARTGYDADNLPKRFRIQEAKIQDVPVLISRTGYTGEDGVEIVVPNAYAGHLWELLLDLGGPLGIKPIGLGARDTLRLEAAYPLHGHDISENDTPLEAGLGWSVKLEKPIDFIGKPALLAQKENGLPRGFYCFTLEARTIPRQHDVIVKDGEVVGEVTSGSISPLFNVPVGMGYIRAGAVSGPGDHIHIRCRGKDVEAEIVERPFYQL